jgi:hypothetical protein
MVSIYCIYVKSFISKSVICHVFMRMSPVISVRSKAIISKVNKSKDVISKVIISKVIISKVISKVNISKVIMSIVVMSNDVIWGVG